MSKVDAQRAMREAKYARIRASGPTRREAAAEASAAPAPSPQPVGTTKTDAPAKTTAKSPAKTPAEAKTPVADGERCGHKSMNGRVCTREAAHAEKSHRYG